MRATRRSIICTAVVGIGLAGCDGSLPSNLAESMSGEAETESLQGLSSGEALAAALSDSDAYARARNLGELLPTLGPEAIPQVQETLEKFRLDLGAVEFDLLLRFWATHEPSKAMAWTFKKGSPMYRSAGAWTVMAIWAEADPAAALLVAESALRESNEDIARVVDMALVQGWYRSDRVELERYIHDMGSGMKRQRSLHAYSNAFVAEDGSESAIRWAQSIPDEDRRYKLAVYRQLMSALAWADMDAAKRFCDAECDGPYGQSLRLVLVRTWLRNGEDGGGVIEWVAAAPTATDSDRKSKKHTLWVAYSTWAHREPEAAIAWMAAKLAETDEHEPWLRSLYGEYARQLAAESIEEAIRWAERVEAEVDRERTLVRIVRSWRRRDEAAADAWLDESDLSERAREQARNMQQPDQLPRHAKP